MPEELLITLPTITEWEEHLKSHGLIHIDDCGHFCQKTNCIVNKEPRSLEPIFSALDRKEY